jgi:hypothetical protein
MNKKIISLSLTLLMFLSMIAIFGNVQAGYSYTDAFVSSNLSSSDNGEIFGKVLGVDGSEQDIGTPLSKATVSIKKVNVYSIGSIQAKEYENKNTSSLVNKEGKNNYVYAEPTKLISLGSSVSAIEFNVVMSNADSITASDSLDNDEDNSPSISNQVTNELTISSNAISLWDTTFTDENGEYSFSLLTPGWYTVKASKYGYQSSTEIVQIEEDESISTNFTLGKISPTIISEKPKIVPINESKNYIRKIGGSTNIQSIDEAIYENDVGGEVLIGKNLESDIVIYNEHLNINEFNVEKNRVSLKINGDENVTGKTLVINAEEGVFENPDKMIVKYDGETIKIADDLDDVLNPDDDGSHPEYLLTHGANGTQIIVSIPHFSEHEITVYSVAEVVETLGGITAVIMYVVICALASIVFAGSIRLRKRMK